MSWRWQYYTYPLLFLDCQHAEDDSWLAVTWPHLASSEWSQSKNYSANLAKATKYRGRLDSTAKGDEGATQNLVWTTNDNNHLSVTYHDDNGGQSCAMSFLSASRTDARTLL